MPDLDHAALEAAAREALELESRRGWHADATASRLPVSVRRGWVEREIVFSPGAAAAVVTLLEERKRLVERHAEDASAVNSAEQEVDEYKRQISAAEARATAAEAARDRMKAALFPEPRPLGDGSYLDAAVDYDLMGALYDLKRQGADAICIKTIERVLGQLQEARAALAGEKEPKT